MSAFFAFLHHVAAFALVSAVVVEFVTPIQERTKAYLDDPTQLDKVLAVGAEKARAVSAATLAAVYDRVGFLPPNSAG